MEESTYELITKLCESQVDIAKSYDRVKSQELVKKLRINAYEVLLKKRVFPDLTAELRGNKDPWCNLLAWYFQLKHDPRQSAKAPVVRSLLDRIEETKMLQNSAIGNMFMLLLYLKDSVPCEDDQIQEFSMFNLDTLKLFSHEKNLSYSYDIYPANRFILPNSLRIEPKVTKLFPLNACSLQPNLSIRLLENVKTNRDSDAIEGFPTKFNFELEESRNSKKVRFSKNLVAVQNIEHENQLNILETHTDIWDLVINMPVSRHRTWESLGYWEPVKELPFASESSSKNLHHFQTLVNYCSLNNINEEIELTTIVAHEQFVKNLKNMLVGIPSDIFEADSCDSFSLKAGISLEGISEVNLQSYCLDLLQCGSCYRALNRICFIYSSSSNEKFGFMFKEVCIGVTRYLKYYRAVILSLANSTSLLTFHNYIRRLQKHMLVLARLCKVDIFYSSLNNNIETDYRFGVDVLNYMYQEIMKTNDKDVSWVLYSIFYPCCQSYFSRFLQRWLFEGILMDPYEEFFVKSEGNYLKSRSRIYWTRGFSVKQNAVPEFLTELKQDILQCGKYMNLLKLCKPNASLFSSSLSRTLPLMTSCLTSPQLKRLREDIERYYSDMAAICGPFLSLEQEMKDRCDQSAEFLDLVEKIRSLHFKKLELQKKEEHEQRAKQKKKILDEMKEQMEVAVEQKRKAKEDELKNDLLIAEENAKMEKILAKRVEEESKHIHRYYEHLIEAVDKRREQIEKMTEEIKVEISENSTKQEKNVDKEMEKITIAIPEENPEIISDSETRDVQIEVAQSSITPDTNANATENLINNDSEIHANSEKYTRTEIKESETRNTDKDKENANVDETKDISTKVKINNEINETFLAARRNRAKILNLEFGVIAKEKVRQIVPKIDTSHMTEAQRNKMKVLSSEFDIFNGNEFTRTKSDTIEDIANMANEKTNFTIAKTNENLASPGHENVMNLIHRKNVLQKELPTISESSVNEFYKDNVKKINNQIDKGSLTINIPVTNNEVVPMSIDSTPMTELPTPSSMKLSLCTDNVFNSPQGTDSALLTTNSNMTDDGFKFPFLEPKKVMQESAIQLLYADKNRNITTYERPLELNQKIAFTKDEIRNINNNNIKLMLHQSVILPLEAQSKLVNNEILTYFVHDQKFFSHLHSLRCYYFLLDGEFGRRITEGLFNKLYGAEKPVDLLNCRSLQLIIDKAIYASSKTHENAERLSFIIQNIPNKFDLSNSEVLDCLALSYRVHWPLNILLPTDTIEKYNDVFKYLLKLHHMSWILQKMMEELKVVQKTEALDYNILMLSPQYHQIQLYRYIMTHFVQTLQNYTVSQVLQTSWSELEKNIKTVSTLDQLYAVHIIYVKTIMFRCLLNKKCSPIRKVILEIFAVILKFYNCLRSAHWILKPNDEFFTHPNFKRLKDIFHKFEEFANFIFRVGSKMARVGYQPHLIQMLDMLNMNLYYTSKQNM